MDFQYHSPRDLGGTLHLSPTHLHHVESCRNIRRSLSRSPSRNMNFQHNEKHQIPCPQTPATASLFTSPLCKVSTATSAPTAYSDSDSSIPTGTKRSRPSLRRSAPLRLLSESRTTSKSPIRRALSDSSDQGNGSPGAYETVVEGQENSLSSGSASPIKWFDAEIREPPVFETGRISPYSAVPLKSRRDRNNFRAGLPVKSSPLKRSDGIMNLDQANSGSPSAKRRSIHAGSHASPFALPSNLQNSDSSESDPDDVRDSFFRGSDSDTPTTTNTRLFSLRPSLQTRRPDLREPRLRRSVDFALDRSGIGKQSTSSKARASLDGAHPPNRLGVSSHRRSSSHDANRSGASHEATGAIAHSTHRHPLSHALSPASSSSSITGEPPSITETDFSNSTRSPVNFSKSLPIGAVRPLPRDLPGRRGPSKAAFEETFGTPENYKIARPDPAAFRSTGLISKRYRNPDDMPLPPAVHLRMPDTPCKGFLPDEILPSSPTPVNSAIKGKFTQPQFGTPTKSFSSVVANNSLRPLEKSASIFERSLQGGQLKRHDSFVNTDDEDSLPSCQGQGDSQSSNDELPPTPTKSISNTPFLKSNSLRSSLFGRRTSIGPNTFLPPSTPDPGTETQSICKSSPLRHETTTDNPSGGCFDDLNLLSISIIDPPEVLSSSFSQSRTRRRLQMKGVVPSPLYQKSLKMPLACSNKSFSTKSDSLSPASKVWSLVTNFPPHTPVEHSLPDPSSLSISPQARTPHSPIFSTNQSNNWARAPETPTTNKDEAQSFGLEYRIVTPSNHSFAKDVDPVLISRFKKVEWYGGGEFSDVYRVFQPSELLMSQNYFSPLRGSKTSRTPLPDKVWIVKKSKFPYHTSKIRQRKFKEVQIMRQLGKSDHVVELIDSWEANQHLYIQTEFCEEGNLHGFLARTGHKGRLDDFRIWKILIELSQGLKHIHDSGFIHLDLKPANVFIDFEGVLKIGDFGLASEWPAPAHVEGEGDRRYIGPDLLQGSFDKPADVFALGMIMFEIAGNCILPDNGASWHQLRSGDWSNLPSLTSGSTNSIFEDSREDLVYSQSLGKLSGERSHEILYNPEHNRAGSENYQNHWSTLDELAQPPNFMLDPNDEEALDQVVRWMMLPNPKERPVVDQVLETGGVQWVNDRRRAGAVVFEGNWGPPQFEIKLHQEDSEMIDAP